MGDRHTRPWVHINNQQILLFPSDAYILFRYIAAIGSTACTTWSNCFFLCWCFNRHYPLYICNFCSYNNPRSQVKHNVNDLQIKNLKFDKSCGLKDDLSPVLLISASVYILVWKWFLVVMSHFSWQTWFKITSETRKVHFWGVSMRIVPEWINWMKRPTLNRCNSWTGWGEQSKWGKGEIQEFVYLWVHNTLFIATL